MNYFCAIVKKKEFFTTGQIDANGVMNVGIIFMQNKICTMKKELLYTKGA